MPAELLPEQAAAERWPFIDFTRRRPGDVPRGRRRARPRSRDRGDAPAGGRRAAPTCASTPRSKRLAAAARRRRRRHHRRRRRSPPRSPSSRPAPWIAPLLDGPGRAPAADRHPAAGLPLRPGARGAKPSRGRSSSTSTAAATATGCPAAATAGRRARSRSASTIPARPPPPPAATSASTRPPGTGCARSCADRLPGLDPAPGQRGELPLHVDRERGLHPRPAGRRAVRGRVALLGPRREVRPAAWRDHRRPGRGPPAPDPRFTLAAHLAH